MDQVTRIWITISEKKKRKCNVMHFEKIKRYDLVHWNLLQLAKQNSLANRRVKQLRLLDKTLLPLVFCHC